MTDIAARFLVPGDVTGRLTLLGAPLSLWGGYDVQTGTIIDVTHPQCGALLAGRIVAMREARGSSSSASALVEAARRGMAPSALMLGRPDPILIIGALVALDLYRVAIPVLLVAEEAWATLQDGATLRLSAGRAAVTSIPDRHS